MSRTVDTEKFFRDNGVIGGGQALASLRFIFGDMADADQLNDVVQFVRWACVRTMPALRAALAEYLGGKAGEEETEKGLIALARLRTFPELPTGQAVDDYLQTSSMGNGVSASFKPVVGDTVPIWFFSALGIIAERAKASGTKKLQFARVVKWHLCNWGYKPGEEMDWLAIFLAAKFYDRLTDIAKDLEPNTWRVRMIG